MWRLPPPRTKLPLSKALVTCRRPRHVQQHQGLRSQACHVNAQSSFNKQVVILNVTVGMMLTNFHSQANTAAIWQVIMGSLFHSSMLGILRSEINVSTWLVGITTVLVPRTSICLGIWLLNVTQLEGSKNCGWDCTAETIRGQGLRLEARIPVELVTQRWKAWCCFLLFAH